MSFPNESDITVEAEPGRDTRRSVSRGARVVILLGAGYSALGLISGEHEDSSVLWFIEPLLVLGFVVLLWRRDRKPTLGRPEGRQGAFFFIAGSWLTGMLFELSLRTGATGFGGMHPDTGMSFLLAQGFYVPFAAGGWWLARRFGYGLEDVFWTGALSSLYEMLTLGATALGGDPALLPLAPLLIGYYLMVYGLILAMPLLFIDERRLWRESPRPISWRGKLLWGVGLGMLCWVCFVGWAIVVD